MQYSSIKYSHYLAISPVLIHVITRSFLCTFDHLHPVLPPLPHTSENHKYDLYFCKLGVFKILHIRKSYSICLSLSELFYLNNVLKIHPCHRWQDFLFMAEQYSTVCLCVYVFSYTWVASMS